MPRASATPISRYLKDLWEKKGTDLLLTAGIPPMLRVDGVMRAIDGHKPLGPADVELFAEGILTPELMRSFRETKEADFSFNWEGKARFRANAFMQRGSMAVAFRLIPFEIPSFEELRIPKVAERFVKLPQGLVLVTGPTGCGKSTTLASMIDSINATRRAHILTIEDPIEYVHKHNLSAVNQRELGEDTLSFLNALRAALREDPDVLLVGEMRDLETIQTVLTIAETGHLVFATLHTNDTSQALDRIVDVFPGERQQQIRVQLANSLGGIIYQQLLPMVDEGQVAAFEVLVANHPIRNLIREGKTRQIRNQVVTGQQEGMQTLEMSLSELVREGLVTHEEAQGRSLFPNEVKAATEAPATQERRGLLRRRQ